MNPWDIVNSPVVVTVISFILGGLLVAFVSAKLQQRSQRHSVRLALTRELLSTYHDYIRLLRRPAEPDGEDEFDRIHAEFMSHTRITKVMFSGDVHFELNRLAKRLANIQQLRQGSGPEHVSDQLDDAYRHAESIFEGMFMRLDKRRLL